WYPWQVPLVLASRSPRRREILERAGIPHTVLPSDIEEDRTGGDPREEVLRWSRAKAGHVAPSCPGRPVLGADTLVRAGGLTLGKPLDETDAVRMLRLLSGRPHIVFGGVCVLWPDRGLDIAICEETRVIFRALSDEEIEAYVATREPMDKAGAYGIQGFGSLLVERIEGCFFNVMGLPLARTMEAIRTAGPGLPRP
ncbi:septum formation protein Maf, partial [Candidatus Fermentibacterales bacterium]|nr:septum formation protein Maf [Candidatus Fermentibacterales bacterium]